MSFPVPSSALQLGITGCGMCYPVYGAYKRSLTANQKNVAPEMVAVGFLSHYLSDPLLYDRCHKTINKMC